MQMNQVINQNGQYNEKLKVLLNELNDEVIKCQKDAPVTTFIKKEININKIRMSPKRE